MATIKLGSIFLGDGDLQSGTASELTSGTLAPDNGDGNDGDVYIYIAGSNSTLYIKKNSVWVSLIDTSLSVSIPDNTADYVWASFPSSIAKYIGIEYGVSRGSNLKHGELATVTDGVIASLNEFGIVTVNASSGVTFDAQINASNIELTATTDAQGVSAALRYFIRSWN